MRVNAPTWLDRTDPYYWVTAQLSARGWRMSAGARFTLASSGLLVASAHAVLIAFGAGAKSTRDMVTAAVLLVSGLGMATIWLTIRRWPPRWMSYASVVIGAACTTLFCLTVQDPLVGLFGATVLVLITAYVAVFHHVVALIVPLSAFLLVSIVLTSGASAADRLPLIVGTAVLLLFNVAVYAVTWTAIRLTLRTHGHDEFESLTALPNEAAFQAELATLIGARARLRDRHLMVGLVSIDGYGALRAVAGVRGAQRVRIDLGSALRSTLRRDAIAAHISDDEFVIADVFESNDPMPLLERLAQAIGSDPSRTTVSVGAVCRPLTLVAGYAHPDAIDALITLAGAANSAARMAGGNTIRCDVDDEFALDTL